MSATQKPTLVVVSGPPGSGKTTLAHEIARALPCPAICRDEIKEGMVHAQGPGFQGGHSDPLTQRTLPLFFEVVHVLIGSGVTVVAEAAFQAPRWKPELESLSELARLRIIRCNVAASVAFERAVRRAVGNEHRLTSHGDSTLGMGIADWERAFGSFEHISLPASSLDVDTTDQYNPALDAIVHFINQT